MKKKFRWLSLLIATIMIICSFSVLSSCKKGDNNEDDDSGTDGSGIEALFGGVDDGYQRVIICMLSNSASYGLWDFSNGAGVARKMQSYESGGGLLGEGSYTVFDLPISVSSATFCMINNMSADENGSSNWGSSWTKDYDADYEVELSQENQDINEYYFKPGSDTAWVRDEGGTDLVMIKKVNYLMDDLTKIYFNATPGFNFTSLTDVKVINTATQEELSVSSIMSVSSITGKTTNALNESNVTAGYINVSENMAVNGSYKVVVNDYEDGYVVPHKVFDTTYFKNNFTYTGDDLGAIINGSKTMFKLWAPVSSSVNLIIYESASGGIKEKIAMTQGEKGVWYKEVEVGGGTYYNYEVVNAGGTSIAVDPYARSANANGERGMVVDLNSNLATPTGWNDDDYYAEGEDFQYTDANIWEVHIKDFSFYGYNKNDSTQPASRFQNPGKYLAFTETGVTNNSGQSIGIDYVASLGITHIHLLPSYDYASVDENNPLQFNWGYDPQNYNVPEGSYSTNPNDGYSRVKEYRQMVQAVHNKGMGVVMDVVYNHTYSLDSNLNKVVPYYFYRTDGTGAYTNGSGCGNETASERAMYSKYMIDSVLYWQEAYHLDGFRFDLMGLHDVTTMKNLKSAVKDVNPNTLIYGEGWDMGALSSNDKAMMSNINKINAAKTTTDKNGGVAMFNDQFRKGAKGDNDGSVGGYVQGQSTQATMIKALQGGAPTNWFTDYANQSINYCSAHDNLALWDKLNKSMSSETEAKKLSANRLAGALTFLGQGVPFMQAGQEMLRSKQGNANSYNAPNSVNNIDWDSLTAGSNQLAMMEYYKGLMAFRKAYPQVSNKNKATSWKIEALGASGIKITAESSTSTVVILFNNSNTTRSTTLDAGYSLYIDGTRAGTTSLETLTPSQSVSIQYGCKVYVKNK